MSDGGKKKGKGKTKDDGLKAVKEVLSFLAIVFFGVWLLSQIGRDQQPTANQNAPRERTASWQLPDPPPQEEPVSEEVDRWPDGCPKGWRGFACGWEGKASIGTHDIRPGGFPVEAADNFDLVPGGIPVDGGLPFQGAVPAPKNLPFLGGRPFQGAVPAAPNWPSRPGFGAPPGHARPPGFADNSGSARTPGFGDYPGHEASVGNEHGVGFGEVVGRPFDYAHPADIGDPATIGCPYPGGCY